MVTNEETIKELEKQLEDLKKESSDETKIKQLERQIKAHKFLKTKTGKFIDKVGGFGQRVSKKLFTQPQQQKGKKKGKTVKELNKNIQDVMDKLPQ